jgi:hypothetical protein
MRSLAYDPLKALAPNKIYQPVNLDKRLSYMLNQSPIFLNCFSRGGSNILWNLFLTHPDVCSPIKETLEIFRTNLRSPTIEGYLTAFYSKQFRLFDQWNLNKRQRICRKAQTFIDRTFYRWKCRTTFDSEMCYKYEKLKYSDTEVRKARLVAKNNNALAFLSDIFYEIYPDATFIALVRHPFAIYESHKRRNLSKSPIHFANFFSKIANKMIQDEEKFNNYLIVKFEYLLEDTLNSLRYLYAHTNLDLDKIRKIRFKAKPHYQPDGQHTTRYAPQKHYWFELDEIGNFLDQNINNYQINKLKRDEKRVLYKYLEKYLIHFGYNNYN